MYHFFPLIKTGKFVLIFLEIVLNLILKCNLALLIDGNDKISLFSLFMIIWVPPIPYCKDKIPFLPLNLFSFWE